MREIQVSAITDVVERLCIEANTHLPGDVKCAIETCRACEDGAIAQGVLDKIIENYNIADSENVPICQDTGMACVFLEIGQDVHLVGGDLREAVDEGVRRGYGKGYLRKSVVADPVRRGNTGDNTPAMLYTEIVPGENVKITVGPKGFGSENMSAIRMFKPSAGLQGIKDFIIEAVETAGPNPCPPMVVGVGIGGTFEKCAYMAKKALTRDIDKSSDIPYVAELEKALEDYEEELDKGIEDGTLVEIDINKIADEADKKWKERFEAEGLTDEYEDFINNQTATDEALAAEKALSDIANSLEGTVAENAENIAKFNEMFDYLFASLENCLRGTHNFKDYEVTSPAKCEVNAIETRTCWFCGETDEREVEGTALSHSFTKYEETEAPKCGVEGKEVAYCDNGCQTTDERETPALEHIFLDYVSNGDATCTADGTKTASCLNGCGTTDTVADEGSMLDHTDEDGDKLCDDCGEEVYDRCDICGGKAHGDDKIQLVFCMIITIIRFVTAILKSIN